MTQGSLTELSELALKNQYNKYKDQMDKAKLTIREIINELIERSNSNMKRLRELENQINSFDTRIDTLEKTVSEDTVNIKNVKELIEKSIRVESKKIENLENMLREVIDKLKRTASASKIKQLESLIEMYNPLKSQFVTKEEVRRLLKGEDNEEE